MRTDQGRSRKQNIISVKGAANNPANTSRNNENKSVVSDTNIFSQNIQSHVCSCSPCSLLPALIMAKFNSKYFKDKIVEAYVPVD